MNNQPTPKRGAPGGAPGAKVLITAASLSAVIGGWAGFALSKPAPADASLPAETPAQVAIELQPLPTLVPEPTASLASVKAPPSTSSLSSAKAPSVVAPTLRKVTAPPRPVTVTRSSR